VLVYPQQTLCYWFEYFLILPSDYFSTDSQYSTGWRQFIVVRGINKWAKPQNTGPLIYILLNHNSAYWSKVALVKITVHSTAKFTKHVETASEARASEAHGMEMTSLAPEKFSGGAKLITIESPKISTFSRLGSIPLRWTQISQEKIPLE